MGHGPLKGFCGLWILEGRRVSCGWIYSLVYVSNVGTLGHTYGFNALGPPKCSPPDSLSEDSVDRPETLYIKQGDCQSFILKIKDLSL